MKKFKTVDEYFAALPKDVRDILQGLRTTIRQAAPQAEETISYSMPAFKWKGILVWYAAHTGHVGFYPKSAAIVAFKDELAGYKTSKGAIQFPIEKRIPTNLVKKIVKFRIQENEQRTAGEAGMTRISNAGTESQSMKTRNPKVDAYVSRAKTWQQEVKKLRSIVLDCQLTEELKWGVPCYTSEKNNVVLIHVFKEYCALLFFKGALLKDAKGILVQQTKNVQAARQMRFTNLREIAEMEAVVKAYLHEAIAVENAGLKVKFKKTTEFAVPEEFQKQLDEKPALKTAFDALTPGRQRAYILHFTAAKQSKTRESRVEKCLPQILKGKGLND
jgi:uncharacterized protein YdeI (YjbR/CyaY-like superfamily)